MGVDQRSENCCPGKNGLLNSLSDSASFSVEILREGSLQKVVRESCFCQLHI